MSKCNILMSVIEVDLDWENSECLQRRTLRTGTIFGNWKPFKNDEKCILFHFKSFFYSEDI